VWLSPRGENLLFSVLFRLHCAPADDDVLVKWPNDVLVRSPRDRALRKVAGVLVETGLSGAKVQYVVVGIGINVLSRALPEELAAIATSIALERDARGGTGRELDRAVILADVLEGLDRDVGHVAHRGLGLVHARLTRHDALAGKMIESVADDGTPGDLHGVAEGIHPDGRLVVRTEDGAVVRVASGEVRLRVAP
jgi:BirA family biotin operon repressor/biotin-[acetyl-CoA-carboxylase] ligase